MDLRRAGSGGARLVGVVAFLLLAGCARNKLTLELRGTIMYAKPEVTSISHSLVDSRAEGGNLTVRVTLEGDPALTASFDISPGIAEDVPMEETEAGVYVGEYVFPPDVVGGPFTVVGRLRHEEAGEVVRKDPEPLFIPLPDRRR